MEILNMLPVLGWQVVENFLGGVIRRWEWAENTHLFLLHAVLFHPPPLYMASAGEFLNSLSGLTLGWQCYLVTCFVGGHTINRSGKCTLSRKLQAIIRQLVGAPANVRDGALYRMGDTNRLIQVLWFFDKLLNGVSVEYC
jgi:hypothetical protein